MKNAKNLENVEALQTVNDNASEDFIDCSIHVGNGNIFADTGRENANELQAKAILSIRIEQLIRQHRLTQIEAADRMNVSQPDVSLIVRGRLKGFTIDRLIQCVQALGQDVRIVLPPVVTTDNTRGQMVVSYEDAFDHAKNTNKPTKRVKKRSDERLAIVA